MAIVVKCILSKHKLTLTLEIYALVCVCVCVCTQPLLVRHMLFFTSVVNVPLVLVTKVTVSVTMYCLKLSSLCDLLGILFTLGPEASGSSS